MSRFEKIPLWLAWSGRTADPKEVGPALAWQWLKYPVYSLA